MSCIIERGFNPYQHIKNYDEVPFRGFRNSTDINRHNEELCQVVGENSNQDFFELYRINQQKPKHPQFAIKTVRHSSYRNFPTGKTQTSEELAEAGLFYSGQSDLVFCFSCGQGLKSWEPEDIPWIEHAKWSPKCRFVHDVHGPNFVNTVLNAKSDSKEMIKLKESLSPKKSREPEIKSRESNKSGYKPSICLLDTVAAKSLLTKGFSRDDVWKLIKIFVRINGCDSFRGEDLLKTSFALEDGEIEDISNEDDETEPGVRKEEPIVCNVPDDKIKEEISDFNNHKMNSNDSCKTVENIENVCKDEVRALLTENEQLKNRTMCKICLEEKVSIVFLPCGHLACCSQCAPAVRTCPICRTFIKGTVKTFLL